MHDPSHSFVLTAAALCAVGAASPALAQTIVEERTARDGSRIDRLPHAGPGLPLPPLPDAGTLHNVGRDSGWQPMSVPANVFIRAISMASPDVGFAAAELGIVLRTTDGGNTWVKILDEGFPIYWYGVHAFDEQTILITGFHNTGNVGIFRWSDDGGHTWGDMQGLSPPVSIRWLYFVNFANADRGVIQGAQGIHYTTNGGRTPADWTHVKPTDAWFLGPFTFLSDLRVWMTGHDNVRSTDGGMTWVPIPNADPTFDGPSAFTADNHGFIGGGSIMPVVAGWLYSSTDGGDSWSSLPDLQTPYPIRAILKLDDQRAWAVGGNFWSNPNVGGIWGTTDGGQTWTLEQDTGAELVDIQMVPAGPGAYDIYAVGMISQLWRLRITTPCYANCTGSTAEPILTVDDFTCFINEFAAAQSLLPQEQITHYANCDGSTSTPVLTVDDFTCFINEFAQGCP